MKKNNNSMLKISLSVMIVCFAVFFTSCNKDLPVAEPADIPELNPGSTETLGQKLSEDPDYSLIWAVYEEDGISKNLLNKDNVYTVIAPNNNSIQQLADAITIPSMGISIPLTPDLIKNIPPNPYFTLDDLKSIAKYTLIPGEQVLSTDKTLVNGGFPNIQLPSSLIIGSLEPQVPLPVPMTIFPSDQNGFWVNQIPIAKADEKFSNGALHTPAAVILPPSGTLWGLISEDPDFSLFRSAMAVANTGIPVDNTSNLIYLLNYPLINATVLVPTDAAIKDFLFKVIFGTLVKAGKPLAEAQALATALSNDPNIFSKLPDLSPDFTPETIYGLLAYHIIAVQTSDGIKPLLRVFPNNLAPATPTALKTLVNSGVAEHPGVMTKATFGQAGVSDLTFTGFGNLGGGDPFSGTPAHAIPEATGLFGTNCVNGIYYKIDQILLAQNLGE